MQATGQLPSWVLSFWDTKKEFESLTWVHSTCFCQEVSMTYNTMARTRHMTAPPRPPTHSHKESKKYNVSTQRAITNWWTAGVFWWYSGLLLLSSSLCSEEDGQIKVLQWLSEKVTSLTKGHRWWIMNLSHVHYHIYSRNIYWAPTPCQEPGNSKNTIPAFKEQRISIK